MIDFPPPLITGWVQRWHLVAAVPTRTSAPKNTDICFQKPFLPDVQADLYISRNLGKAGGAGATPANDFKAENAAVDQKKQHQLKENGG